MKLLQNSKFTGPALILLLVLNTALLVMLLIRHQPPPPPPPFQNPNGAPPNAREFLVHELKMDGPQQKRFDALIQIHHGSMEKIQQDIRMHRDSMINQLGKQIVDSLQINSIADQIGKDQAQIEKATFLHFREVRQICTPAQQPKFDTIIREALRFMGPPNGPPPPPGNRPPPPPGNGPPPPPGNGPPPPPGNGLPPPPGNGPPPPPGNGPPPGN